MVAIITKTNLSTMIIEPMVEQWALILQMF